MFRSIGFRFVLFSFISIALGLFTFAAEGHTQEADQDKHVDIQGSSGNLHLGNDADARKAGLPLYPGARLRHDEDNTNAANLSLFTEALGIKLVFAKYESNDAPAKIIQFYREKLQKYGKVIECHTTKKVGDSADVDEGDDSKDDDSKNQSAPVKCVGNNTGPVTELKVGTENNQHVVAIQPKPGKGSTFSLVYVRTRGKEGDI